MRRESLWARDAAICHLCLEHVDLADASRDHIIPRSERGSNDESNLKLAHLVCNWMRGNKAVDAYSVEEYRAHRKAPRQYKPPKPPKPQKVSLEVSRPDWDWRRLGPDRWRCNWCGGNNDSPPFGDPPNVYRICAHCLHYRYF